MQGRRGGEADLDGVEIVQHAAVFGDVVVKAPKAQLGVRHLAVQRVAPVAFVNHHAVVGVHCGRGHALCGEQHAAHHALHGGDVHRRVVVGRLRLQLLDAKDFCKGLQALHARVFEGVGSLLAQGRAVHQKQNASKALGLEQAVDQRDAGFGFASAGGHGQQDFALALRDARFGLANGALLVGPQRKAKVKCRVVQARMGSHFVGLQQVLEPGRAVPAVQGQAAVFRLAQVAKPDAALGGQLAQIRPAVGREHKGNAVLGLVAPMAFVQQCLAAGAKGAAVALGLLQGARYIDVLALGLHHGDGAQALKQHIVGRVAFAGPFGNRHMAATLGARAFAVAQGGGVGLPAGLAQLRVDDAAGLGLVELHLRGGAGGGLQIAAELGRRCYRCGGLHGA